MLNRIQRKWMKKVLKAVTKWDCQKTFLAFEYKKQRKTKLEKLMYPGGYSRSAMLYAIYCPGHEFGDKGKWMSKKEAKLVLEQGDDIIDKVVPLRKGIKLLFKYNMMLDNDLSSFVDTPVWFTVFDEWFKSEDRKLCVDRVAEANRQKRIEELTEQKHEKNKFKIVHV